MDKIKTGNLIRRPAQKKDLRGIFGELYGRCLGDYIYMRKRHMS